MKYLIEVKVTKVAGRNQDPDSIAEEIDSVMSGIGSVFVDDGQKETESEYDIEIITVRPASGGRALTGGT